jgi:hypothetical protein
MKRILALAALAFQFSFSYAQSYDSLLGPKIWLRADQSELKPTSWSDVGAFKNHAVGLSATSTPSSFASINYNKALSFDGIDDYFKLPYSLETPAELSVFAVFQATDTTEFGVWGLEESATRNILLTNRVAIGPSNATDKYGNYLKLPIQNSLVQTWEKAGPVSSSYLALGSAGTGKSYKPFRGSIAEFLVFDRALTFLERVQLETYLAIKYGTGLRGGNFVSSKEKLLWHVNNNAAYGVNMAGIGRDDFFKLYQKQSGSAYDLGLMVMSSGTLAASNAENKSSINDQDFILWGDNNGPLSVKQGNGADSILIYLERKWRTTATGNTANKLSTEMYLDAAQLPGDAAGFWLVIDRSGQGNYSVDNLEYIKPAGVLAGKLLFKNVLWDKDGSGKDNFGFVRERKLLAVVRKLSDPSCTNEKAGKIKVETIAGKAPFHFKLTSKDGKIKREWKQQLTPIEQDELLRGDYTLTVTDGNKESLTRQFTMIMPDAIDINLGPDKKFTTEPAIVLDVTSQVPANIPVTYQWENSFGFSSDAQKIAVTEPAVYRVLVTKESDGCVFIDQIAITGAEENRIAVYPTITNINEEFKIGVSLNEPGDVDVRIFNSMGLQIQEMTGANNSEYQFISSLKDSGTYLIVIQTRNGSETRKLVVH